MHNYLFSSLLTIRRRLADWGIFDIFANRSYAQEGEDMILRGLFPEQQHGFYVDIGASHPKRFSNTYFFYRLGWRGINIDAMPNSMKLFNLIRPHDINLEVALSEKREILTYHLFNEPALNSFSKEISKSRDGLREYKIIAEKELKTKTLAEILDQYLPPRQRIDFLSVDVEGWEYPVLKSNNWNKYRPTVILVEALGSTIDALGDARVIALLNAQSYQFFAKTTNTLFFKNQK